MHPDRKLAEKNLPRDPVTRVILGAEPFEFGDGKHAVLFMHGWTSSPRELRFLAERIAKAGFHCRGILLKGHGTTTEDLEPTRFKDYLSQCENAFDELAKTHAQVSVCGLSMGGLLALHLAATRPVASQILLAPFLTPWGKTFGLPNRWLIGRVPLPRILLKESLGPIKDLKGLAAHIAYYAMPSSSMVSVIVAARKLSGKIKSITCPTLIFHSVHDTTSDFSGSQFLIKELGSEDKTLVALSRSNHVITLDFDRERIEAQSVAWLQKVR